MLQALEFTDAPHGDGGPSSLALFRSALLTQPSIAQAVNDCGIPIAGIDLPALFQISDPNYTDPELWHSAFEPWFRIIDDPDPRRGKSQIRSRILGRPTQAYHRVRSQKQLSLVNAISGSLEARYLDDRVGRRGTGKVSTNDLVGIFADFIGAEIQREGRCYLDETAINDLCAKLSERFDAIYAVDPSAGRQQFILYHDGRNYRIRPFGSWGAYQLQEQPLPDGSLWVARTNLIQPLQLFTSEAIEELESLINSDARESEFQSFFELHPEFLLALGDYKALHPQLILHEDDGGKLIPDFFLEKINSDLCDICDLKRPTAELIRHQRHRVRFRDAIHEAVAQLDHYRDWFEDRTNREAFKRQYGLSPYRPKVVVVIGRQLNFYDDIQRIKLESELPAWVSLKTYDDIVAKARQWKYLAKL